MVLNQCDFGFRRLAFAGLLAIALCGTASRAFTTSSNRSGAYSSTTGGLVGLGIITAPKCVELLNFTRSGQRGLILNDKSYPSQGYLDVRNLKYEMAAIGLANNHSFEINALKSEKVREVAEIFTGNMGRIASMIILTPGLMLCQQELGMAVAELRKNVDLFSTLRSRHSKAAW